MPEPADIPIELHNWLRIVTLGLDEAGRRQVREDVILHYSLAWGNEVAAGVPEAQARAKVITALGDPWQYHYKIQQTALATSTWSADILEPIKTWWRWRHLPAPDSLENWLAIATHNLCDNAKTRIRSEIETHLKDSLYAIVEIGVSPSDAMREGLAGLGDPRQAHRFFQHIHLTRRQDRILENLKMPLNAKRLRSSILGQIFYSLLMFMINAYWGMPLQTNIQAIIFCIIFLGCINLMFISPSILFRHFSTRQTLAALILVSPFYILLPYFIIAPYSPGLNGTFCAVLGILFFIVALSVYGPIWLKLGRKSPIMDEYDRHITR